MQNQDTNKGNDGVPSQGHPATRESKPPLIERLRDRLWAIECDELPWWLRQLVKLARIVCLVINGFLQDECAVRASGLAYYTMISLVPVLVIALALARLFGGESIARDAILRQIDLWAAQSTTTATSPESTAAFLSLVERIKTILDTIFVRIGEIRFGTLGGIGLVLLLWSAVEMMARVEASFNHIWGVSGRTLWRRFADYLTVMLIVPFLLLAATTLPMVEWISTSPFFASAWSLTAFNFSIHLPELGTVVSILMLTVLFTFILIFMPNTRVRLIPGITGGLVTAIVLMAWLHLCAALQIGVAKYGRLYGGFAAAPILLAWIYVSWEIVLLGEEVAFAVQNVRTYGLEDGGRHASARARAALALEIATAMAHAFSGGVLPFDPEEFAARRRISIRYLNEVVDALVRAGIAAELAGGRQRRHVLLRSPERVTVQEVLSAVIDQGISHEKVGLHSLAPGVEKWIQQFLSDADAHLSATLADLLEAPRADP
ncbi:MAG: YihY/virulence factor BrkB family protein [Kiritimatiellia bacterium]|jgi:membrane protein